MDPYTLNPKPLSYGTYPSGTLKGTPKVTIWAHGPFGFPERYTRSSGGARLAKPSLYLSSSRAQPSRLFGAWVYDLGLRVKGTVYDGSNEF